MMVKISYDRTEFIINFNDIDMRFLRALINGHQISSINLEN